jgi:hypothetical protein
MDCYNCGIQIEEHNKSEEHVINNSLGGHLTSTNLICDACNNFFGHSLDVEVDAQIGMFSDLLGIKRHRENKDRRVRIEMISEKGEVKVVGRKMRPLHELSIDTGTKRIKLFEAEGKYERLKLAKKSELTKKFKVEDREYIQEPDKTKWHVKNSKSDTRGNIGFGGYDYFRGIARICLNFYLSKGHSINYAARALDFVKGKIEHNDLVFYYYPTTYDVHQLDKEEVSHILHLRGDTRKKLLYTYIELFNFQNVLVIFDKDYEGNEINDTYVYDLVNGIEVNKTVSIRLPRHHVEIMHMIERDADREHLARYNRFQQIMEKRQLLDD